MKLFTPLFLFLSMSAHSQTSFLRIGGDFNINLYAPYTSKLNEVKSPYKINSYTWNANIDYRILQKGKISLYVGVDYKKIKYIKKDAISSFSYSYYCGSQQTCDAIFVYNAPADLVAKSHSLGLSTEVDYLFKNKERYTMSLGVRPSVYFLEWYKASYVSSSTLPYNDMIGPQPLVSELPRTFFLSSVNTALVYRITLLPKTGRKTLSGKVSLGANLFSDWSQFKRYAWLGVGLEIGFLGISTTAR